MATSRQSVVASDEQPFADNDELRRLIAGATERGYLTFEEIAVDFRKRYPFASGKRPEVI